MASEKGWQGVAWSLAAVVAAGGLAACSAGDTTSVCSEGDGGSATVNEHDAGAGGAEGATASNVSTASAPPPAWGPPAWSACLTHGIVTTCSAYCASFGLSCSTECQSPYTGKYVGALTFNNPTCTSFFPGGTACDDDVFTSDSARCCCGI